MSQISPVEAREFIRLLLVAEVESRDSDLGWDVARRLAAENGLPTPLTDRDEWDLEAHDYVERNAFYWGRP